MFDNYILDIHNLRLLAFIYTKSHQFLLLTHLVFIYENIWFNEVFRISDTNEQIIEDQAELVEITQ